MEAVERLSHIEPISIEFPTPSCPIHKRFRFDALSLLVSILFHLAVFVAAIQLARPGGGGFGDGSPGGDIRGLGGAGRQLDPFHQGSLQSANPLTVSLVEDFETNNQAQSLEVQPVRHVVQESHTKQESHKKDVLIDASYQALSQTNNDGQGEIALTKLIDDRINGLKDTQPIRTEPKTKQKKLEIRRTPEPINQVAKTEASAQFDVSSLPAPKVSFGDGSSASTMVAGQGLGQGSGFGQGNGANGGEAGSGLGYRPILVKSPKPDYPSDARDMGFEGAVALAVMVDTSGEVQEVDVVKSSGRSDCDAEAAQTVKSRWKFRPAQRNGAPVAATERVEVVFKLYS